MASRRLSWSTEENALTRALAARRLLGRTTLDLTESNPTQVGLPLNQAAILAALAQPAALVYEPHPQGLMVAREAVARYYAGKRVIVHPGRVLLTASTSEAYSLLFKLLCDPGDAVLVPEPSYPLFGWLTALEAVQPMPYSLRWDGEWHLDAGLLRAALDAAPRAKAILVVNPGNPTGAFLKQEERGAVARLCRERGLALISDEVFADFAQGDDARRVETVAAHDDVLSFALSGLSKVAGLPQLKLGWCVVAGPQREAERAMEQLDMVADTYLSVSTPAQVGAPAFLELRHDFQRALRGRLSRNRAALRALHASNAPWDLLPAEGGWMAVLSVPRSRSEEEWALALLDAGVLVHPGYFFDFPDGAHLIVSLLPPEDIVAEAARRIAAALSS